MNNRYDFVFLFDVKDANPNGDPDAGNLPRIDPETNQGLVTDVCLKRKIRNYVLLTKGNKDRFSIFVTEKAILNEKIERAYTQSDEVKTAIQQWDEWKSDKKKAKPERAYEDIAKQWLCENFFDIRTFGAVLNTGDEQNIEGVKNKLKMTAGQVRGPAQISFARSIDPIVTQEHALTVVAARKKDKPVEEQIGIQGRKFTVPYALYRCQGIINPFLAEQTFFSEGTNRGERKDDDGSDLELLFNALENSFQFDASSARPAGSMAARGLFIFKHDSQLGSAPSHKLFDSVVVKKKDSVDVPRSFSDYEVTIDESALPKGVTLIRRI
jgi:CRISPR-associated protein Csd2